MITTSQMYWMTRLDGIRDCMIVFILLTVFSAIGVVISYAITFCAVGTGERDVFNMSLKIRKICGWIFSVCLSVAILVTTFVPTTKEMAAIYIVPKIVNSEKIQNVGNQVYELAVQWMEELKTKSVYKKGK